MRADLGSRSLTVGLVLASLVLGVVGVGFGQIPRMINYQGRLVDATGAPLAGSHTVVFRIFGDVVGGAQLWTETQSVTADSAGIFGAILGAVDPIDVDFDSPRWLEVEVDGQVLAPRREMTSVPFAFQAANSHMLQGLDADAFADSAHSHHSLDAADGSPTGVVYVDDAGNVGVGTQTPEAQLDVAGTARTSGFEMPTGAAAGRVLTSDANGTGTWQAPAAVPDADWVIAGDNMYSGVPGKVGIGNTSPYARFDVKDTSSTSNVVAIYGRATSSNAQGSKGVLGETYSTADVNFGIGVGGLSNGTQGSGVGVSGASYGPTGKGVEGTAVSNSGVNYGVYGRTYSPDGYAGYFIGDRSYFNGHVGVGVMDPQCPIDAVTSSQTSSAKAIRGVATGGYTEGQQVSGVYGRTESAATTNPGAGVFGAASASTGGSAGVRGESAGQTGKGLFGWATHTSGKNYGVYGETMSSNGYAGYFLGGRNYFQGRVGIGIDNPQEQLHVDGGASTVTVQLTNDTSGATASDGLHLLLSPLGDGRLINDEARNLDLGTAGVPRLSIFPSGKIGIGGYDTLGIVTITDTRPYLALNSTDQGSHPASGIYFYYDGTLKGGITWGGFDNLISIGNMNVNLSNYRVGVGAIIPQNLLDVMGAGTAWGGVNGYTEVVGHFTTTGSGHTAISVDAVTDQDAILYLAENGKAYWDLRNDSDNGKQFELRYHGLGAKNVTHVAVDTLGNVGIGTTNTSGYKLYVAGTAYSTGGWSSSDARLKDKIAPIEAALSKALALRGVSFEWRRAEFPDKGLPEGRHYGLIAQEVEKVLPEVVKEGPNGDKAVAYSEIIPVLVESIKELKAENESLRQRIEALEQAHGRE